MPQAFAGGQGPRRFRPGGRGSQPACRWVPAVPDDLNV